MNRLQKKCVLASVVLHGLLLLVLVFGAAFQGKPEPVTSQRLNVIPSKLIEAALAGGGGNPNLARTDDQVKGNTTTPVPPSQDTPPVPKLPENPPRPTPPAPPTPRTETRPPQTQIKPAAVKPTKPPEPVKPNSTAKAPNAPPKPLLDLVPTVRGADKAAKEKADAQAREGARQEMAANRVLANRLNNITSGLKAGFESGTKVEVGGTGGEAYANYAFLVQTVYDAAWQVLPDLAGEDFIVPVEVVIGRDGRILSQRMITRSGNSSMDRSVQRALDKVKATGLRPFPEGTRDTERSFRINFNLKARRQAG